MTAARDVEIAVTEARAQLSELLDTQVRDGGVVYLTRYGRRVGAVVSAELAEHLGELEDAYWSQRANDALARLAQEPAIPWDRAIVELERGDAAER